MQSVPWHIDFYRKCFSLECNLLWQDPCFHRLLGPTAGFMLWHWFSDYWPSCCIYFSRVKSLSDMKLSCLKTSVRLMGFTWWIGELVFQMRIKSLFALLWDCDGYTLHDISLIPLLGLGYNVIFFVLHVLEYLLSCYSVVKAWFSMMVCCSWDICYGCGSVAQIIK